MLFTAHVLSSGAIGESIGNPFLAFLLGALVHLVLDAIPHYDTTDGGKITLRQMILAGADLIVGCYIIYLLSTEITLSTSFFWGAVGGMFPDLLSLVLPIKRFTEKSRLGKKFQLFHENIQKIKLGPVFGLLVQVLIWALSIGILIFMHE